MSENVHPKWSLIFELMFKYRGIRGNVGRYLEDAKKTGYRIGDVVVYRYFGRAEIAFQIGWPDDANDPKAAMETVRTEAELRGLPYTDESGLKKNVEEYRQCWEALVMWCQSTDAWKPYAAEMGKRLQDRLKESDEPQADIGETTSVSASVQVLASEPAAGSRPSDTNRQRRSLMLRIRDLFTAPEYRVLPWGVLIGVVLMSLLVAGLFEYANLAYQNATSSPARYFSTFGTEIPAHDDPTLSLTQEVKRSSDDQTGYSRHIQAKVDDILTITIYVYNPRKDTVYHGGRLYDELPPGGGTITLRSSLNFTDPALQRDSSVTVTIPAAAHLEYADGCGCGGSATSVRVHHEGAPETNYGGYDLGPGNPMFLAGGYPINDLAGGNTDKPDEMDPNRLWFSYDIEVVANYPDMPVWNTGATANERDWFQVANVTRHSDWSPFSLRVFPGDELEFRLYVFNDSCGSGAKGCTETAAQDSLAGVILPPHGGRVTAVLASRNGALLYRDLNVTLPPDQTMTYEANSTIRYSHPVDDPSQFPSSPLPDGVVNGSVHLGDICCFYNAEEFVAFWVKVSNRPAPKPAATHDAALGQPTWGLTASAVLPMLLTIFVLVLLRLRSAGTNGSWSALWRMLRHERARRP